MERVEKPKSGVHRRGRVLEADGGVWVGSPGKEAPCEPEIILIRDGDQINAIEVVCTCGRKIRMNCVF